MPNPISKILKKLTHQRQTSDPFELLPACMSRIANSFLDEFSKEPYGWQEAKGVKTFECLVLSKFLLDHALLKTFVGKLDETSISLKLALIDSVFKALLQDTFRKTNFSLAQFDDTIKNRLVAYSAILAEQPHPRCWQMIAGTCTGIDYYSQQNLDILLLSSTTIPALLIDAQDCLQSVIDV